MAKQEGGSEGDGAADEEEGIKVTLEDEGFVDSGSCLKGVDGIHDILESLIVFGSEKTSVGDGSNFFKVTGVELNAGARTPQVGV